MESTLVSNRAYGAVLGAALGESESKVLPGVVPIAARLYKESHAMIAHAARVYAARRNADPICMDACAAYCVGIASLIRSGIREDAHDAALSVTDNPIVREWIVCAEEGVPIREMGIGDTRSVRWGLMLAFYHMWNGSSFEDAIRKTVSFGGDADTNICVVGGIMGARFGKDAIPHDWIRHPT